MTGPTGRRDPEARIAAFFATPQLDLPDRAFDVVRSQIHRTRRPRVVIPRGWPAGARLPLALSGVVAILVMAVAWLAFPSIRTGPAGQSLRPSPTPSAESPVPSPASPTRFSSALYGYTLTIPAGWAIRPAIQPWDGLLQPAFGGAETDAYTGPGQLAAYSFAGPFPGDLQAFVDDRIAANARDHASDCPSGALQVNEPVRIGGQPGVLLGWNCGALIGQAVIVRDGVAYAFAIRDLAIKAARDRAVLAIFQSMLDSVVLPPPSPSASS